MSWIRRAIKRLLDIVVSALALVIVSPVIAVVAVAVRVKLGSPVIFRQDRPGRNEVVFTLLKFRTMRDGAESDGERLTRFGQTLRSASLDELPSFINVLRGEMSLVGPRPLLVDYLPLYSARQRRRHDVRPGLTGLAQASGRNSLDWADRLELDVVYVEQQSLRLDCKIVGRTIRQLADRSGINQEGTATMSRFDGA